MERGWCDFREGLGGALEGEKGGRWIGVDWSCVERVYWRSRLFLLHIRLVLVDRKATSWCFADLCWCCCCPYVMVCKGSW